MNKLITLVFADDYEPMRSGFNALFRRVPDIDIIGLASNGKELVAMVDDLLPDIVITDINMPEMSGLEAIAVINHRHPDIPVIALTMHKEQGMLDKIIGAGAVACLPKNASKEVIIRIVKSSLENNPST